MEKSATLHYINLALIPCYCDAAPKQSLLYPSKLKSPAVISQTKMLEPPLLVNGETGKQLLS